MPHTSLLKDLAVVMAVAAAVTALARFLRQPVVLGYLVAGLLTGPHVPYSLVGDVGSIRTMADLGIVFLMFALGLEFSLPRLARVGLPAAAAGLVELTALFLIGSGVGSALGWDRADRTFLGAMLAVSSTTIIVKTLTDLKKEREDFAQLVFGLLIVEDLAAVLLLSLLPVLAAGRASPEAAAGALRTALKIGFFVVFFLTAGLTLAPRLLKGMARFHSREALGITALAFCLIGAAAAGGAGFSVALGAFLAGAVVAASEEAPRVEIWFHPVRDMFSALFFVSAGMLIVPSELWAHKGAVLAGAAAVVLGKAVFVGAGILGVGYEFKTAIRAGLSMGQIGEFSFVIAGAGAASGLTSGALFPVAVGVSTTATLFSSFLIRRSDAVAEAVETRAPSSLLRLLERYRAWFQARLRAGARKETVILSKYMVRLVLYTVLFAAAALVARGLSVALGLWMDLPPSWQDPAQAALWLAVVAAVLPVSTALAKYADHFALLLFTWGSPSWLLTRVNIRFVYGAFNGAVMLFLFALLATTAAGAFAKDEMFAATALAAAMGAWTLRGAVGRGREALERLLDEVVGLATSEPNRQAVMKAGRDSLVLRDITEEAAVPDDGGAAGRTLAELRLRELTGASVVALYRHGRHTANPGPDVKLEPGDVVVLLGDPGQRRRAAALLAGRTEPAP